jgi:hypothetical protein
VAAFCSSAVRIVATQFPRHLVDGSRRLVLIVEVAQVLLLPVDKVARSPPAIWPAQLPQLAILPTPGDAMVLRLMRRVSQLVFWTRRIQLVVYFDRSVGEVLFRRHRDQPWPVLVFIIMGTLQIAQLPSPTAVTPLWKEAGAALPPECSLPVGADDAPPQNSPPLTLRT